MKAEGWSLDDKRQALLIESKLGLQPIKYVLNQLSEVERAKTICPMC
jgi:type I restriction enzyme M protein